MKSILGYAVQFLVDGLEGDAHREALAALEQRLDEAEERRSSEVTGLGRELAEAVRQRDKMRDEATLRQEVIGHVNDALNEARVPMSFDMFARIRELVAQREVEAGGTVRVVDSAQGKGAIVVVRAIHEPSKPRATLRELDGLADEQYRRVGSGWNVTIADMRQLARDVADRVRAEQDDLRDLLKRAVREGCEMEITSDPTGNAFVAVGQVASDDGLRVDGTYAEARVPRSDAIPTLERMLRDRVGTEKVGA